MSRFWALLKMNGRLLFRNKGFLFFLCITPIVSAVILNLKMDSAIYESKVERTQIVELEGADSKAVYVGDTSAFIIKVYDASGTELSEYLLHTFTSAGIFSVCRYDARRMSDSEVERQAETDAFDDRAGILLYLKSGFDESVLAGEYENAFQLYDVSDDGRQALFEEELTAALLRIRSVAAAMNAGSIDNIVERLQAIDAQMPQKAVVSVSGNNGIVLTDEQINKRSLIGYAFAILTLGCLLCGVCVAHTVIEEQNNRVYMRMMLSKLDRRSYFCSKFVMVFFIGLIQTGLLGICLFCFNRMEVGILPLGFLGMILCLGLIFGTISLLLGMLSGDVMSANYAVFALWSISALLSGLYFSIDMTSPVLKEIANLMPHRWFMRAAEQLLAGDNGGYLVVLYTTSAYLIISLSIGGIGLKIKRFD